MAVKGRVAVSSRDKSRLKARAQYMEYVAYALIVMAATETTLNVMTCIQRCSDAGEDAGDLGTQLPVGLIAAEQIPSGDLAHTGQKRITEDHCNTMNKDMLGMFGNVNKQAGSNSTMPGQGVVGWTYVTAGPNKTNITLYPDVSKFFARILNDFAVYSDAMEKEFHAPEVISYKRVTIYEAVRFVASF